jgi:hypothetical protein
MNALARPDVYLADSCRIGSRHHLQFARRYDLTFATGHLVYLRKARPKKKKDKSDCRGKDDKLRATKRPPVSDRGPDER